MSCRLPPVPPNFQRYGSVSLFLILRFDFFRPFEGANQTKKQHCNWGCGDILDYKGLDNSSIYGSSYILVNLQNVLPGMESVFISKIQHKHPTENPSIFHRELGNYVFLSPDRALSYDNHQLRIVGGIDLFEAMLQQIQLACQDVDKLSIGDTITCQGRSVIPEAVYGGIWWDSSAALGDPLPSHHFPSLRR